ncbi:hypothetical protein HK100_007461 [Physocladia obscura]|uniref:RhoGAP-domain-containing protein n=1 Tax=Physocladia obscura TaxID=109957 RepID=A0AAD5TAJ2_9FUNG|nr:hypothetical protein HK100_007461 [Physocladia obscura]
MWNQETETKDKDEETLAEMAQHLRLVRRGGTEEIARTAVLIGRLGDAKSLAALLTTTAVERNLNGTIAISTPASNLHSISPNLHTISLNLHSADSDTYKSESDLDDADDDLIPTETMPSRAQVRRSILSVINGNSARFSLSAPPQQQVQQPQPLPPSPLAALSADSASSAGSSSLKFSLLSNIKEDEEFDNSSLKSANTKQQQRYPQTIVASAPVLIIPRRGQSATTNTTLLSSTPPTTNTTSPLLSSIPNLTPPSTASSLNPLSSFSADDTATATAAIPPVLVRSSSLETATAVNTADENVAMEGFLVKKLNLPFGIGTIPSHAASGPGGHGHAFGWKPRYYKLKETVLEEFDSKTNSKVGIIAIRHNTIITVLQSSPHHSVTGSTAHAFTITEPRISPGPGPSLIKHTLCTHAQADRDKWVDAISSRIRNASEKEKEKYSGGQFGGKSLDMDRTLSNGSKRGVPKRPSDSLKSSSATLDNIKVSERSDSLEQLSSSPPKSPVLEPQNPIQPQQQQQQQQQHSTPPPAQLSQQNKAINILQESARKGLNMVFGNNSNTNNNATVHKKTSELELHNNYILRSWHFSITNTTPPPPSSSQQNSDSATTTSTTMVNSTAPPIKPDPSEKAIFGKPLALSVSISRLSPTSQLSSVVSRCLEFLESPAVIAEEGIYRLSGSTLQIQALRNQFDVEGDVDLVRLRDEGKEIVDVHAVTGLLKLYLRELADSVLGDGQIKFDLLKCAHLPDKSERTKELTHLLPQLPDVNYALLKRIAQHLNLIIQNKDLNKMSINNLSIIFAPTLNVPGQLLQVMILDWETVFPR